MKLNKKSFKHVNLALIIFFIAFTGWEAHVFKLWVVDILGKAKVCDEIKCREIQEMATELDDYKLPPIKKKVGG